MDTDAKDLRKQRLAPGRWRPFLLFVLRSLRAFAADPRIYTNETSWAGAAITTWNYDQYRGWLNSKAYHGTWG